MATAKQIPPPAPRETKKTTQSKPKKDGRRKTGPVPYSTTLQRRKKTEIRDLRLEAQQLNAQLVELQQRRHNRVATAGTEGSDGWRSLAVIEGEERQRAERCNRELKAILSNQHEVHTSIRRLMRKNETFKGLEFLRQLHQLQPAVDRSVVGINYSNAILADLASSLDSLRLDAIKMLPPPGDDLAIVCRSQNRSHPTRGHFLVETTTTTPLACTMRTAGDILWGFISNDVDKSFHSISKENPHSFEMNCVAKSREGLLCIDGVNIYRSYDEVSRTVVVGTSTWMLPSGGLQFEDRCWIVITPSPADPLHASVVQTRYQLQAKLSDRSIQPIDFVYAQEAVMSSIGTKLRNAMQALQTALLDEVNGI